MNLAARFIPTALTLALGFSIQVDHASAQAMISYGHGVAKAAGAGAAVGGGIGGTLTGLGNPLSTAAGRRGSAAKAKATVRRQTVPVRRGAVTWDAPQQGFGAPTPLPLIGGIQASGSTDSNWQPTLLEPSQNLAVISASWGGPGIAGAGDAAEAVPAEETPTDIHAATAAAPTQDSPLLARSTEHGSASSDKPAPPSGDAAPASLPEGVAVGAPVEQVLEKLGRPYLSFRGVAGEGYTDQYVFTLPDGAHLVVYVLDGVVAHLAVG